MKNAETAYADGKKDIESAFANAFRTLHGCGLTLDARTKILKEIIGYQRVRDRVLESVIDSLSYESSL